MIKAYKEVGETPLELIERIRKEKTELKDERLSYAGRLDPMAEGETIVLVGDENNKREKYLGLDKEYEATFLVGVSTDSNDVLGLIKESKEKIDLENLEEQILNLKKIKKQKYPWFSGKTVEGKKLFDHFKEDNLNIKRPDIEVEIKELEFLGLEDISKEEIENYILNSIKKVKGDFRQEKILEDWRGFFKAAPTRLKIFKIKTKVSSGTFIRSFAEEFSFPVCLLKLKRTKVIL